MQKSSWDLVRTSGFTHIQSGQLLEYLNFCDFWKFEGVRSYGKVFFLEDDRGRLLNWLMNLLTMSAFSVRVLSPHLSELTDLLFFRTRAEFNCLHVCLGWWERSWHMSEKWSALACLILWFTSALNTLYLSWEWHLWFSLRIRERMSLSIQLILSFFILIFTRGACLSTTSKNSIFQQFHLSSKLSNMSASCQGARSRLEMSSLTSHHLKLHRRCEWHKSLSCWRRTLFASLSCCLKYSLHSSVSLSLCLWTLSLVKRLAWSWARSMHSVHVHMAVCIDLACPLTSSYHSYLWPLEDVPRDSPRRPDAVE